MKKRNAIAYIDGFNLYHSIRELNRPELKWANLWSISESLLREGEVLIAVKYFSAYATWLPDHYRRHRQYTRALQEHGVQVVLGKFKDKFLRCRHCRRRYSTKEEKETDVNIALHLVSDALADRYDRAILISADTDMRPAIDAVHIQAPGKYVFVVAPPKRMSRARGLDPKYELKPGRIANHLLNDRYFDEEGAIIATRPVEYTPIASGT